MQHYWLLRSSIWYMWYWLCWLLSAGMTQGAFLGTSDLGLLVGHLWWNRIRLMSCELLCSFLWAVWYKTKFGSQNFGCQIWFCTRLMSISSNTGVMAMGWCRKDVTPVRQQWSYVFVALNHLMCSWYIAVQSATSWISSKHDFSHILTKGAP